MDETRPERAADAPEKAAARPEPKTAGGRTRRTGRRRLLVWVWPLVGALLVGVVGGVGVAAAINMPRVESITEFTPTLITELYDRDGDVFATYARERRMMIEEGQIPEIVERAVVSAEDGNFYQHGGIDAIGIVRAATANLQRGERFSGASTITMQLARMLYLSREKKWRRKIEEAFLAVELEKSLTKQQILTLYCNLVNLGHGRYGVEAASRYFFNKPASELELVEAATLAGIIQRPSDYSPYRRPDMVTTRRNYVLERMAAEGYITREELAAAKAEPLLVVRQGPREDFAPYFAEEVRQHLEAEFGATRMYEGGLQVATTLDRGAQQAAEKALRDGLLRVDHQRGFRGEILKLDGGDLEGRTLPSWDDLEPAPGRWYQGIVLDTNRNRARVKIHDQTYELGPEGIRWTGRSQPSDLLQRGDVAWFRLAAPEGEDGEAAGEPVLHLEQEPEVEGAVVVLESASGAVRAMVGGWDFDRSKFNRAVQAERQVGSAFKLFVYGAALEEGYTAADTIFDGPTAFPGADARDSYRPQNHGRRYYGILTMRRALEASINIPAVKVLDMVGVERVIDFARRSGVDARLPPYPSLALGAAEMRPIELAAAYAAIANQGTWVKPYFVERVRTPVGRVLEEHFPETRTTTSPEVAYVLTRMLEGVVDRGTARRLSDLPVAIAGKTGTTDDYSDAWFIGYTPRYTVLTWVGYDVKRSLGRGRDGASVAAPIWKDVLEAGLEQGWIEEGAEFQPPAGIVFAGIDFRSGLLSEGGFQEAFVAGTQPARPYSGQWGLIMGLPWYQQQSFYLPKQGERMPSSAGRGTDEAEGEDDDLTAIGGEPSDEAMAASEAAADNGPPGP